MDERIEVKQPRYFTVEQAADFLNVSTWTVRRWIHNRATGFPFIKVGGVIRFDPRAIEQWMSRNMVKGTA